MKPLSSLFVILILFQSLFLGSLVKLEIPVALAQSWDVTLIHKPIVLDPFLLPAKEGIDQNSQNKNEWLPIHFNTTNIVTYSSTLPLVSEISFHNKRINNFKAVPAFILNGNLRI